MSERNVKLWYYNKNLKPQGPVSELDLRRMISLGELGPYDLVCSGSESAWKPAIEWPCFESSLFPAAQGFIPGGDLLPEEKMWVLLVASQEVGGLVQEGPYCFLEVLDFLRAKKISGINYIWKSGLTGWSRIQDRPEFVSYFNSESL